MTPHRFSPFDNPKDLFGLISLLALVFVWLLVSHLTVGHHVAILADKLRYRLGLSKPGARVVKWSGLQSRSESLRFDRESATHPRGSPSDSSRYRRVPSGSGWV